MFYDPGLADLLEMFEPDPVVIDKRDDKQKRANESHKIIGYLRDDVGVGGTVCREVIADATGTDGGHVHVRIEHLVNVDGYRILGGKARYGRARLPLCECHRTQTYSLLDADPVAPEEQSIALKLREVGGKITIDWDGPTRVSDRYTEAEREVLDGHLARLVTIWRRQIGK